MGAGGSLGCGGSQRILTSQGPRKSIAFTLREPFSFTKVHVSALTSTFLGTCVFLGLTPHFARGAEFCSALPWKSGNGQSAGALREPVKSCLVSSGETRVQGGKAWQSGEPHLDLLPPRAVLL